MPAEDATRVAARVPVTKCGLAAEGFKCSGGEEKNGVYDNATLTISNYLMAFSDMPPTGREPRFAWACDRPGAGQRLSRLFNTKFGFAKMYFWWCNCVHFE